jgi:hypothetical protein
VTRHLSVWTAVSAPIKCHSHNHRRPFDSLQRVFLLIASSIAKMHMTFCDTCLKLSRGCRCHKSNINRARRHTIGTPRVSCNKALLSPNEASGSSKQPRPPHAMVRGSKFVWNSRKNRQPTHKKNVAWFLSYACPCRTLPQCIASIASCGLQTIPRGHSHGHQTPYTCAHASPLAHRQLHTS